MNHNKTTGIQFQCPCPGCLEMAPVKFDRKGRLYLTCDPCAGRIFGTRLVLGIVQRNGGEYYIDLEQMTYHELADILRKYE